MKIIFLGTNGWFATQTGNTNCILLDTKKYYIVIDAGDGIYKIDQYITEDKPVYLFISHLHIDHIEGLHMLSKFKFTKPLNIFSHPGSAKFINIFKHPPFSSELKNLKYPAILNEIPEGKHNAPFTFQALQLLHANISCFGYKFFLDNKIVTYCADTGICENDLLLARDSDVLIHECSFLETEKRKIKWGHTAPLEAAQLAKDAKVKKLILTHFDASKYKTFDNRQWAEDQAKKIFPNTVYAKDDMIIEI